MKNYHFVVGLALGTCLVLAVIHGCGQHQSGGGGGVTTNYTIQGKYIGLSASSVKAASSTVTDIVAIGADG
jgi:hypothetical protein